MKLYYYNDERFPVAVKTNKLGGEPWEWDVIILKQCEGRTFDIDLPEGKAIYVKKWPDVVMITTISEGVASDLDA